jgi:hypothetical protein
MGAVLAAAAIIGGVLVLIAPWESSRAPEPSAAAPADRGTPTSERPTRFGGAREKCSTRSEANFAGGFTSSDNLVVDPLVVVGGAYTDPGTVRDFGGNKLPVLVKAGHSVTVRIARPWRRVAGLAYGRLPQGRTTLRDTHRTVTFVACRPGKAPDEYSPRGPSGSHADGVAITFWSGFILTRVPACIPLDIYADGATAPRRVGLGLGRRCEP